MFKLRLLILFAISLMTASCSKDLTERKEDTTQKISFQVNMIEESFLTRWYEIDNIDSPAFWSDSINNWIIATAKESDFLVVYSASTGETIKYFGKSGTGLGQFKRPNGIMIFEDLCFVVERDNHRIQVLKLPNFEPLMTFGDSVLIKPYGLTGFKTNGKLRLYVTDNYETVDEQIPPDSELGERVRIFELDLNMSKPSVSIIKSFGETSGEGVLSIVESIYADVENNLLLIAEEEETQNVIKLYDLDGNYLKKEFGKGYFSGQIEGIALYKTSEKEGFWIITDQSSQNNVFQIFDRKTLSYIASFKGQFTLNTDGVALTQLNYKDFPKGAFFACNDDGGISAFSLENILTIIKK